MDLTLGRFGDRRLEKGGTSCTHGLSAMAARASVFGDLAVGAPERCGLRGFCIIGG
jgi:hypothetical protein